MDVIHKTGLNITVDFDNAFYNESKQRVVNVTCNHDGSIHQRKLDGLYSGKFICPICDYKRYEDKVINSGFTLLGKRHNGKITLVKLQCLECNDIFERASPTFFNNSKYHCFNCIKLKYSKLLIAKNCTYINHYIEDNGKSTVCYKNDQGEIRKLSSSALLDDQWVTCSDKSWWEIKRKTFVYKFTFVITNNYLGLSNGEYFKIGSSTQPERRLNQLNLLIPVCLEVVACSMNSRDVRFTEKTIRDYYVDNLLSKDIPERFTRGTSKRKLKNGSINYKADGATEWLFIPAQ